MELFSRKLRNLHCLVIIALCNSTDLSKMLTFSLRSPRMSNDLSLWPTKERKEKYLKMKV